jgi:arsenite methyltransferase
MQNTLEALAEHHVDGEKFMQIMQETAAQRFDDGFWASWSDWIVPILSESPQIADFGCGPGALLQRLRERYPQARLIGVECAPYMLEKLDNRLYEVINHDLQQPNLPIAENSLDAITLIFCIHETSEPIQLLQSLQRCLKPGGRSLIIDWVRAPLESYIAAEASEEIFDSQTSHETLKNVFTHFMEHNRYSREDVAWMLEKIGLTVLENVPLKAGRFGRWIVEKPKEAD